MTVVQYPFVGKPLTPLEQMNKLKVDRQLTDADIDRLHITIVGPKETKEELGWNEPSALIRIPYFGITGEKLLDNRGNQLCRYRRTIANDKGERYTQRRGSGARHYLPLGPDWGAISKDPNTPIYYTEGEFKAISATSHLGPCIGNAGVSAWRGSDGSLAAPLEEFVWKDRDVFIVYDAESTSTPAVPLKPTVSKALGELAVDLQMRGAKVKALYIAKTKLFTEGTKLGVDDYFALEGSSRVELLATAATPEVDEEWARMFARYALFQGTKPHIKNIIDGDTYNSKDFADYIERTTRVVDGKSHKIAILYRDHKMANTFNKYVFDPNLEPGYLKDEQKFNTWQGFEHGPKQSGNFQRNIDNYVAFTDGVWGSESQGYFLDWASHLFQRPGELTTISPILVSRVKGVGKSLTGAILRAIIGTRSSFVGSVEGLTEKHTGELEGKLLVQIDEADALFAGKENRLKALDSDEIRIRKMNTDGYTIKNIMRKFYTTNENAAFRIAADERRYYVVRVPKTTEDGLPDAPWNIWLRTVIVPMLKDHEALSDIAYFLMTRDISKWDPTAHVPRTEAMLDMVEAGESKKNVMAEQLYEQLSGDGMWATDSMITSVDNKMWGEIKAITKDNGGVVATHLFKDEGKVIRAHIYMTKDNVLETVQDKVTGRKLVGGQLTASQIRGMLMRTKVAQDAIRSLVDSNKF